MVGTWKGIVEQGSSKYPVTLTLTGGAAGEIVGHIEYSTLPCKGDLTLLSGGSDVRLDEDVSGSCYGTEIQLEIVDGTTMAYTAGSYITATLIPS